MKDYPLPDFVQFVMQKKYRLFQRFSQTISIRKLKAFVINVELNGVSDIVRPTQGDAKVKSIRK